MKISKEAKVGLLAIVSGVVLYLGFNFLKGVDFFSPNSSYYAVYDNIDGLEVSNSVTLNGLRVGRVKEIRILQDRNNQLLVKLDIDKDIMLGDSTKAVLASSGPLGGKYVMLQVGPITRVKEKEDTLISTTEQGITDLLKEKAMPIADNLDSTLVNLNVLVKKFQSLSTTLDQTMSSFRQTSSSANAAITENKAAIRGVMANLNTMSATLNDSQNGLKPMMRKMNSFADTLNQMELARAVDNANKSIATINEMLAQINQGQGTLGKLTHSDSLYTNLNNAVADLDSLFLDIKDRPGRYIHFSVFGKKDKKKDRDK